MKTIVGVADMKISAEPGDILVTHALGSCLGIAVYDPVSCVGGLLHVMLPDSRLDLEKAEANPMMFVDTGVPIFFREIYKAGGVRGRLIVKVVGGASIGAGEEDRFAIGKRNYIMLKKLFWKNDVLIKGEEVGGKVSRTVYLEIGTGRVWLHSVGMEREV